jgi:hypothetical protein
LDRTDSEWPHHFVVLVLDDVAMPHELPGVIEFSPDAGDFTRIGDDGVLEPGFPWFRGDDVAGQLEGLDRIAVRVQYQSLTVHDFEHHLMDVHRMRGHQLEMRSAIRMICRKKPAGFSNAYDTVMKEISRDDLPPRTRIRDHGIQQRPEKG